MGNKNEIEENHKTGIIMQYTRIMNFKKIFSYCSLSDVIFIIVCTMLMSLPASYEPNHFAKALFGGAFIQSLAYSIIIAWLTRETITARILILVLSSLLFYVETYCFFYFGSRLNPGIMTLILQTTPREIIEFIQTFIWFFRFSRW